MTSTGAFIFSLVIVLFGDSLRVAPFLGIGFPLVTFLEWIAPLALVFRHLYVFFWESRLLAVVILPALDRVTDMRPSQSMSVK